jgi:hypothetical protein
LQPGTAPLTFFDSKRHITGGRKEVAQTQDREVRSAGDGVRRLVLFVSARALLATGTPQIAAAGRLPARQILARATPSTSGTASTSAPSSAPAAATQPAADPGLTASIESRISDLHKTPHITPAQEPLFKAFAGVMRANADGMQVLFEQRARSGDMTAISLLRWYARLTTAHAAALNKLVPVFARLYESLSAAQRKAADLAFRPLQQKGTPHTSG